MGTQYTSSSKTQKLPSLEQDSGRWDKLKEHPSSTCRSRAEEESMVDIVKPEKEKKITLRVTGQ